MHHRTVPAASLAIAAVLLAGCGGSTAHQASSERSEAAPPSTGAFDAGHRAEAVERAAKTASKSAPGRLDLDDVQAEFTYLSLPPSGSEPSTMAWCWQISFPVKDGSGRHAASVAPEAHAAAPDAAALSTQPAEIAPVPMAGAQTVAPDPDAAMTRTDVAPPTLDGIAPVQNGPGPVPSAPAPSAATSYVVCVLADGTVRDLGTIR
jgi:hypothetical protein